MAVACSAALCAMLRPSPICTTGQRLRESSPRRSGAHPAPRYLFCRQLTLLYSLVASFPRMVYPRENKTLQEVGLLAQTALLVEASE